MGAGIPLPALHVEAPPQPDTLGNFSKLLAIKQQQAMAPLQQQQAQQQVQAGGIDLQQKQLQMKAQQTLQSIGPQHITRDSQGRPTGYDYDGLMNDATSKGIPPAMLAPIQEMHKKAVDTVLAQTNADKGRIENQVSVNKQAYEQMEGIKALTDPAQRQQAWEQFGQWAQKNGMDTSQAPPQAPDNDTLTAREAVLGMHGQALADAKELAQAKEATARTREAEVNTQKTQQEMALGTGPMAESKYRNILMNEKLGRPVSAEDSAWKQAYEKQKTLVPTANINLQAGLLNDQAKQMAADMYKQTGQLPAGMRSPAMSAGVMNEAAKGGPVNVAANKATYHADSTSLANLQKQFDSVTAFERTAGKNLDLFLQTAKPVLDAGSPLLNKPLRSMSDAMMGSPEMSAFKAARTTALTEIAKVLNNPQGAGVLSDSARHEVEQLVGPDATLKQIYAAANVLKQDMANRHQSYQQQITEIKGRQGTQPQNGGAQSDSSDPFAAFGGKKH